MQRAFKLIYLLKNFDQIHKHKFSFKLLGWRKVDLRRMKNNVWMLLECLVLVNYSRDGKLLMLEILRV